MIFLFIVLLQIIRLKKEIKSRVSNLRRRGIFYTFFMYSRSHLVWIEVEIRQNKLERNICYCKITSLWYPLILRRG